MKLHHKLMLAGAVVLVGLSSLQTQPPEKPTSTEGIQWFATLDSGLAEAKRTGRPIFFVSAAPSCAGVSGIW